MHNFTKFVEAYPIPNMEAETVAKKLVNEYICRYGVMDQLHSDQGRQFESAVYQECMRLLGVHKTRSSSYHPQGSGQVERCNRTIKALLAAFAADQPDTWDDALPMLLMAIRKLQSAEYPKPLNV